MKLKDLEKPQQEWCVQQVARNLDSDVRRPHTKRNLVVSLNTAWKAAFGAWPGFTASTVDTIIGRLRRRGYEIRPEMSGKGVICTFGPRRNTTPAIVDQVGSIAAMQSRAANLVRNQVAHPTIRLTVELIPQAQLAPCDTEGTLKMLEANNGQIIAAADEASRATKVRYVTKLVAVDEDGREIGPGPDAGALAKR